jgi:glycosyltransferase involved in cell wall biosynthesis
MGIPAKGIAVGMVARMARQKDHATLVSAAAQVVREEPHAIFVMAGEGPLRPSIEAEVKRRNLAANFRFLGARRDAWQIMNGFDVCVLSTHFEGCSNVVMEGMAAAKAVVATDVGGNAELIRNGETGYVVRHADADDLAARLLELIRNPEKAAAMGRAARRRIEEEFTIEKTVDQTTRLFDGLLAKAGIKRETGASCSSI